MAMFNSYVKLPEGKQSQNEKRMNLSNSNAWLVVSTYLSEKYE